MKKGILFSDIICALFILLFCYTGTSKLVKLSQFQVILSDIPMLNDIAPLIAVGLPIIEILIAFLLFFPRTRLWGLYSSLFLMSLFTIYVGYMVIFIPHLPCNCGGVIKRMNWKEHTLFNLAFTILSGIGIQLIKRSNQIVATPSTCTTDAG